MELTTKQFRRLLDLAYIGNWVLNSPREDDRITEYDDVITLLFNAAKDRGLTALFEEREGLVLPSRAFVDGGIHEAIMDYEDAVFFEILAEELARRDLMLEGAQGDDLEDLNARIRGYIEEFETNGTDNLTVING